MSEITGCRRDGDRRLIRGTGPDCYLCIQSMYCYRDGYGEEAYERASAAVAHWEARARNATGHLAMEADATF